MFFRHFWGSLTVTIVSLVVAFLYGGPTALLLCAILGVLEISLSFDNAVVNAKVLERMSDFWQKIFLTIGILIAVFGMRLVFPLLIVAITADLGPVEAVRLALERGDPEEPGSYAYILDEAYPQIAAFGGMFLLMLFLDWVFEEREIVWLAPIERVLAKVGKLDVFSVVVAGVALVLAAQFLADDPAIVMISGVLGLVTYLLVNSLGSLFETTAAPVEAREALAASDTPAATVTSAGPNTATDTVVGRSTGGPTQLVKATGKAGFFLFLYLEVLDASFSFDGVIGAFAITSDPIIIALGLGFIGAMFVRSITVFLVRKGTLAEYVYLEHGAHWAIGVLAAILLVGIGYHVNEIVTGLTGVALILLSLAQSIVRRRRMPAEDTSPEQQTAVPVG